MTTDRLTLGVDPSFNRTGWALLSRADGSPPSMVACGIITPSGISRSQRLETIQRQFTDVLARWAPREAYFECPGNWQRREGSRRETIEVMAMARGVMLAACAELGVPAFEVDFRAARQAVIGNPSVRVEGVVEFVRSRGFRIPRRPRGGVDLDIVNAILMGLYGRSAA